MPKWYQIPRGLAVTQREYSANIEGINIVFGAVLGFVLAGAEGLPLPDFIALLLLSASIVIMILYLGSSEYKLYYAALTAAAIAAFPFISEDLFSLARVERLQPTLAIWAVMVMAVELMPKKQTDEQPTK